MRFWPAFADAGSLLSSRRVFGHLRKFLTWLGSHDEIVLVAVLVVVASGWAFVELLDEVREGQTQRFDDWAIALAVQFHGERYSWLEEIGRDLTALGGIAPLALLTAFVVGYLLIVRKTGAMWLVLAATIGGVAISSLLKYTIDRPRPQVDHLSHVYTSSFPSGHSMMSVVVYLTMGALLARVVQPRAVKFYFIAAAMLVSFLVGISRIYMGVHWPTDVLAGWTAGLVWAILCWLAARWLQRKGAVESEGPDPLSMHDVKD
jgi:undecaprenyl-diphosphatase